MSDVASHSGQLQQVLERMRAGDVRARDLLFESVCDRLAVLTRKMLRDFPSVKRSTEVGDIVQNAIVRLLKSLEQVQPNTLQDFYNLATVHLRRELLDLARQLCGPKGYTVRQAAPLPEDDSDPGRQQPAAPSVDVSELDRLCRFHQEVEKLPVEEREVVGLIYYHGWTQNQVAELFQVTERTVRRRWDSALSKLRETLQED
jgi:RNA polymerase sigma-70 factor (ECF subfamily)